MELTKEQIEYLETNLSIFELSSKATSEQRTIVYGMYNDLTGQKKKPNSCGRCWRNVKMKVYQEYKKQIQ